MSTPDLSPLLGWLIFSSCLLASVIGLLALLVPPRLDLVSEGE